MFVAICGIILIGIIGIFIARYRQKQAYNNGVCSYCGAELECNVSYNGNREYFCEECGYETECSFDVENDTKLDWIIRKIVYTPLFLMGVVLQICFVIVSPISLVITMLIFYAFEKQWKKFEWSWYKEMIGLVNPFSKLYFKSV
jgi:hypothetical protein